MLDFDAIVIGSGAGGMTAATALANAGERVLVLERHDVPGGWCHSFTLGGHHFSPGVHYLGELGEGGGLRRIYEGLGVGADLSFFPLHPDGFDHVRIGDDFAFDIPAGRARYQERLARAFPREAEGIGRYLGAVEGVAKELGALMELGSVFELLTLPFRVPTTLRHGLRPLSKVLDGFVQDPLLKAVLSIQCGDHGLPPERVPFALHAAVAGHYLDGGWYPKGGGFALPRAFHRALKRRGGELRLQAEVSRVLVEGYRAIGVRLADGTELRAKRVISNADPAITYGRLLAPEHVPARITRRLARTRWSISALSLFLAVDMDAEAAGLDSGNYWYSRTSDVSKSYSPTFDPSAPLEGMFLTVTTLKDPSKRRRGVETMEAFTMVPYEAFSEWSSTRFGARPDTYTQAKARMTERMLAELDRRVPGLRERVVFSELGTPLTNVHYVNATGGSLYGTEKTLSQLGPFGWQPKTHLRDLWLCGASTVGHGVMGATISGLVAAGLALGAKPKDLLATGGAPITLLDPREARAAEAAPVEARAEARG